MTSKDQWITVEDGVIYLHTDNDNGNFVRKGSQEKVREVQYEDLPEYLQKQALLKLFS